MKKSVIFLFCLILTVMVFGQNETKMVKIDEVEVTPPKFTGVEDVAAFMQTDYCLLMKNFIQKNMIWPQKATGYHMEGIEVVQFTVTPSGKLTNFEVINSVCSDIDKEVIRVLKTTDGMWKPGLNNGEPVAMEREISVLFGNNEDGEVPKHFTKKATCYFIKGGKDLFVKNKPKKALRYYNKGMQYMPYDKSLLSMRGLCHYELGDKESARKDWNRVVTLGGIAYHAIGNDLVEMKGYTEMINILASKKD